MITVEVFRENAWHKVSWHKNAEYALINASVEGWLITPLTAHIFQRLLINLPALLLNVRVLSGLIVFVFSLSPPYYFTQFI
jgi:hypothetical protein